jgi:hypothetical protein
MPTFYTGPRPVLKGRTSTTMIHPYKKKVGVYSFWSNWSPDHVLDGAPDSNRLPGTGYFPGNVFLSQVFRGLNLYVHPLSGTFANGIKTRFKPKEYKGLEGAKAFGTGFGHANRISAYSYNNYLFDGVTSANVMTNVGHGQRTEAQGAPATFGIFIPDRFNGVASAAVFPSNFGQAYPSGYNNAYGKNRVKEYRGVPSARAL